MIEFFSENDFSLSDTEKVARWISDCIIQEGYEEGELTYVFCGDTYLHELNLKFLNHDTLTDIITFDNNLGKLVNGEIYISTDRVKENALEYEVSFENELLRVMIHGVLHLCGYGDKNNVEEQLMRRKENEAIRRFDLFS